MNTRLKIAATGLNGLLGTRIRQVLGDSIEWIDLGKSYLNITERENVFACLNSVNADMLLHLAAFTDVDACEEKKEQAWQVNVEGTRNLFEAAQEKNIKFIYVSTGFVFDGDHPPYDEDSQPHPKSYYGLTKYEGEKILSGNAMIIRIDYPYGSQVLHKKDIVESLIYALGERKTIKGVIDQIMTPTYIDDIAHAFQYLAEHFDNAIFHLVGKDSLSGFDIIQTIGKVFNIDTSLVEKITYDEFYKNRAARPRNGILKTKKNTFYPMKTFEEGLEDLKRRL